MTAKPKNPRFTKANAADLQLVNRLAKASGTYRKFCYDRVKTPLVERYGKPAGYDLQIFERERWDYDEQVSTGEWFSTHQHILARFELGGIIFHQPTDEFDYYDDNEHAKSSKNFETLKAECVDTIEGIAENPKNFDKAAAVKALRRLVRKFKPLLREAAPKYLRPVNHYFEKTFEKYSGALTGWRIRVPNDVAVCTSCGGKMNLRFDLLDVRWFMEDRSIGLYRVLYCDAEKIADYKIGCEQFRIAHRERNRNTDAWKLERQKILTWLPKILPLVVVRDLALVKEKTMKRIEVK